MLHWVQAFAFQRAAFFLFGYIMMKCRLDRIPISFDERELLRLTQGCLILLFQGCCQLTPKMTILVGVDFANILAQHFKPHELDLKESPKNRASSAKTAGDVG